MSADHRRPVVAFVMLALVAAALVGIDRADARGGRLLVAVIGAGARVHGAVPALTDVSGLSVRAAARWAPLGFSVEAVMQHRAAGSRRAAGRVSSPHAASRRSLEAVTPASTRRGASSASRMPVAHDHIAAPDVHGSGSVAQQPAQQPAQHSAQHSSHGHAHGLGRPHDKGWGSLRRGPRGLVSRR